MLLLAGLLNIGAAILHLLIIIGGPKYYLMFGAGEKMAAMAEQNSLVPPLVTLAIAGVLLTWGFYCLSLGGFGPELWMNLEIVYAVTAIYLIRAIYPLLLAPWVKIFRSRFMVLSSLVVLCFAVVHLLGVIWL